MKVLLIDVQSYWIGKHSLDLDIILPSQLTPVGLMYIASYLKDKLKKNVDIKIINGFIDYRSDKDLVSILKEYNPDIVGMRGVNIFAKQFHLTAKMIKQFKRDTILVAGGPYISMDLQAASKDKNIDYFVIGEGEITFAELIEKLLNNEKPWHIKGLAYKKNGRITVNAPRPFIEDLDSLPFPDYSYMPFDKYSRVINFSVVERRYGIIVSSRGCPYRCIFCHNFFGKKFRARSAQNIFAELTALYNNLNLKDFYIIDDIFNFDYQRAMDLFDLIINSGMKINLYFPNGIRGDIIDRKFIDKMVEAGAIWVSYAVETASPRLQKLIKKFINLDKLADNIHYTCEKGIMTNYFFIIGFPTETKEEALGTIEYIKQFKKVVLPNYSVIRFFPNVEIYHLALRNGFKLKDMNNAFQSSYSYRDLQPRATPLISKTEFNTLILKYWEEVVLSKERLLNALEIQKKFYSKAELLDYYSIFFQKKVNDLDRDILLYAKIILKTKNLLINIERNFNTKRTNKR